MQIRRVPNARAGSSPVEPHPRNGHRPARTLVGALALLAVCASQLLGSSAAGAVIRPAPAATLSRADGSAQLRLAPPRIVPFRPVASKLRSRHAARAPAVTTQPKSVLTATGADARFVARASGYPKPRVQWQVSRNGGRSWRNIGPVRGATFSFTAVASQSGYKFRAVFKNRRGKATSAPALLTVVAGGAAPIVTANPVSETVTAGASATFAATASGVPAPNIQWELSDNGGASWADVVGAEQTTLSFTTSSILSGDEFRAVFTNILGSATTTTATLTVSAGAVGSAPVVSEEPQSDDVASGGAVSFAAAASGSPAPSVQWQVSSNQGASWSAIAGATSTTYSFSASAGEDRYEYEAVFTNSNGSATSQPAVLGVGDMLATNWSGYAAVGGPYSAVSGSWTVPTVTCPAGASSDSAQWVGIDGAESQTVEQDGTAADCDGTTASYYAWYEMLGDNAVNGGAEVQITTAGDTVHAGDSITASVSVAASQWTLTVHDITGGWTYTTPATAPFNWSAPARSSAEWIVERPEECGGNGDVCSLTPLADFVSVNFTAATATASAGAQSIAALGGEPVQMIRSQTDSTLLASPGALNPTSGVIFTDTWYGSS
jgi:hypothetical protein